jgi:hypothetical protein
MGECPISIEYLTLEKYSNFNAIDEVLLYSSRRVKVVFAYERNTGKSEGVLG